MNQLTNPFENDLMKPLIRLFVSTGIFLFVTACQKQNTTTSTPVVIQNPDTTSIDTGKYRLTAFEERSDDGSFVYHVGFEYDASGRIIRSFSSNNNGAPDTNFTVTYSGNEAMLLKPVVQMPEIGIYSTDTVRFTLDADNKALKRVGYSYLQNDDSSGGLPIRTYTYDTTVYEYDATGLIKKQTQGKRDSIIWIVSGIKSVTNTLISSVADYTVSDGNVVGMSQVSIRATDNQVVEKTVSFEYSNAYPNHAGLTNPAILKELNIFYDWPLNNNYKNIPERIVSKTIYKDANGTIVNTIDSTNPMSMIFDANGYLTTMIDPAFPNSKWYYTYSK